MEAITSSRPSSLRDLILLAISSAILLPFLLLPVLLFLLRRRLPSPPSSPTPSRLSALTTPLLLLSLLCLGIAGATSLAGQAGSAPAAILARVVSFLGASTADVYLLFLVWRRFARVGVLLGAVFVVGVVSNVLLLVSFACSPTGIKIPAIRAASHILFDLLLSALLFQDLRPTERQVQGRNQEHAAADKSPESGVKGFSLPNFWPPRPAPEPAKWENGEGRSINPWSDDRSPTEWESFRLLVLQSFSVLIAIISVALPIAFDYTYLTAFSTLSLVPTLFGTTSSPTGFVLLNAFVFVRWSGLALDLALPNGPIPVPPPATPPPFISQRFSMASTGTSSLGRLQSVHATQESRGSFFRAVHPFSNFSQSTPQLPSSTRPPPRKDRSTSSLSALAPPAFSHLPPRIETPSLFKGLGIDVHRRPSLSTLQLAFGSQLRHEGQDISTYSPDAAIPTVPRRPSLGIGVPGDDPFLRDPAVEAVEEMWRKRLGSLGEEGGSSNEMSGSLKREMVRVSEEDEREESSSGDDPTSSTFYEDFSEISHRSPTPATLDPPLPQAHPQVIHPYAYAQLFPDPFPAPGTYPRHLFRTHASAPPSSTPSLTRNTSPSLGASHPLGSWSGRSLGATSPFSLKRIKKARGKFGSLGSVGSTRTSSHSDESFACAGEVEKGFVPRTKVAEKVEDFEQLGAKAGSPGFKALHLPGLVGSLRRKRSWWTGSLGSAPETPTPVGSRESRPFSDYQLPEPPLRLSPIGSFELPRSTGSKTPRPRSHAGSDLTPPANPPRSPLIDSAPTSPDPTPSSPEPEIDADETTCLSNWNLPPLHSRLSRPTTPPRAPQHQRGSLRFSSVPSSPSSRASLPSSPSSHSSYSHLHHHHSLSDFSPSPSPTPSSLPLLSPRRRRKSSHDDWSVHSLDSHLSLGRLLERSEETAEALERTTSPLSESESFPSSSSGFASPMLWRRSRVRSPETPESSCVDYGEEGRC